MEGLLDHYLRGLLTRVGGYDLCVSEFIRINNTLLPARRYYQVVPELYNQCRTASGVPVRVQILGSDPICMAENAAKVVSLGAYGIDINFGCPAPTVNRNRGGAALLKEPELMFKIVQAVRSAVPKNIPVTTKMRLGYEDTKLMLDCAQALQDGGAEEIVVHARTKVDGYKPPAYWDQIQKIKMHTKIPIVANGEIWDIESAKKCQSDSGCEDIMLGRGAVSNPSLALMIRGQRDNQLPLTDIKSLLSDFHLQMAKNQNIKNKSGRIKQWLHYLSREYHEVQNNFSRLKRLNHTEELMRTISLL
ncbi:MAG: tRNA-dihydrouridine synthase [Leptospira sp.]|nr:tRNA-dihydrouridine synthase [Leptospira sp.]